MINGMNNLGANSNSSFVLLREIANTHFLSRTAETIINAMSNN